MAQGTTKGVPIDIDPLLANNSDLLVPSQKAIKTYTDAKVSQTVTSVQAQLDNKVSKSGDTITGPIVTTLNTAFTAIKGINTSTDEDNFGDGIFGQSYWGNGVFGTSTNGVGVYGSSDASDGIVGSSQNGNGGNFLSINAVALRATSDNGENAIIGGSTGLTVTNSGRTLIGTNVDNGLDKLQVSGNILATQFKKSGGTSSQYLMADGSVDSNAKIDFKTKTTYALMIADGTPSVTTIYSITNDENKSYTRSTYIWKADGNREWIATTPDN